MPDAAFAYTPRHSEATVLYRVVVQELETFLCRQQERDRPVPRFVEQEFRSFLDCGVLARGFLRLRCQSCGRLLDIRSSQCGAATFIQRFGDALNANPHFHRLVLDGVYAAGENGRPEFHQLPAPENEDVLRLTTLVNERVESLLKRRGLGAEAEVQEADPLSNDDPGMAALLANSVRRRIAVGSNTGRGVVRLGDQIDGDHLDPFESPRCAMVSGFSVHANVAIEARDRLRLERLCRYAARPAVATERLSELPDGRLLYRLKRPWRDGSTAVIFEKQDFIAKLAVLTPAPRAHLTRYHGVLGPCAAWRSLIVPIAHRHVFNETLSERCHGKLLLRNWEFAVIQRLPSFRK
jgi:hypothetical protein